MKTKRVLSVVFSACMALAMGALTASAQTNFWWTNWQGAAQGYN
jgi:hypothetical protein